MPEKKPGTKAPTTAEVYTNIAQATGLSKKEVAAVLEALVEQIKTAINKKGPGQFNLMKLLKVVRVYKEATKKRMVRNPATGEMKEVGPKPARFVVKVRPLKPLKAVLD
jgi:nucleoid DNA-binding protein